MQLTNHYTELVANLLWAGDDAWGGDLSLLPPVFKIISILNGVPRWWPNVGDRTFVWIAANDDQLLAPEVIHGAVSGIVPTYIHCHLGQNRSTAMAVCWWRSNYDGLSLEDIRAATIAARTKDLARINRGGAEISAAMWKNVCNYDSWLKLQGR